MQSSHNEPSERLLWFHHGKQHRQNSFPCCASSPFLPHFFSAHVCQSARHTLPHSLCNRPGPILQNDKVSSKMPDPLLPASFLPLPPPPSPSPPLPLSPPPPLSLPLPFGSLGDSFAAMFASAISVTFDAVCQESGRLALRSQAC